MNRLNGEKRKLRQRVLKAALAENVYSIWRALTEMLFYVPTGDMKKNRNKNRCGGNLDDKNLFYMISAPLN